MRGAIIRGIAAAATVYLFSLGVMGIASCRPGTFVPFAMASAVFGAPVWFVCALACTLVLLLVPDRLRGGPQAWLAAGALATIVFFAGLIVSQISSSHTGCALGSTAPR